MQANKRILLAWENGAGLGHAKRILAVALGLQAIGYEPIVAAREIMPVQAEYRAAGIPVLQAPIHRGFVGDARKYRAQGYADIMATCAWDDVEALYGAVHAWDGLLNFVKPAMVVADYCPILPLAVLNRFPLLVFGDGFVVPPGDQDVLPIVRPLEAVSALDSSLIQVGETVLRKRGAMAPRIGSLGALLNGDRSIVSTYPELDVYDQFRRTKAVGSLERQTYMPLPKSGYLFVYLAADHEHTTKALDGAAEAGLPIRAFIRSARVEQRDTWRARGIFVHDQAPSLHEELRGAAAILHHGGIGTMETALAAGRPQLLLPRHLEQTLNAQRLGSQGVAVRLATPFTAQHARAAVVHVTQSSVLRDKVQAFAQLISERGGDTGLVQILTACEQMVTIGG